MVRLTFAPGSVLKGIYFGFKNHIHINLELTDKEDGKNGVEKRVVISYTMDMANGIILALVEFLLLGSEGESGGTSAQLTHKPLDLKQLFELEETTHNTSDDTNKNEQQVEECFLEMAYKVISAALNKQCDWYGGKIKPSTISKEVRRMFVDISVDVAKLEWRFKNLGNNDKVNLFKLNRNYFSCVVYNFV